MYNPGACAATIRLEGYQPLEATLYDAAVAAYPETLLAAKGDRRGAIEHLNKYLELAPKAAAAGRQLLAELERGPAGAK